MSLFKHAPLNDMWDHTFEGMKVEVINTDLEECADKSPDYFWVATVLKVCLFHFLNFTESAKINKERSRHLRCNGIWKWYAFSIATRNIK